jgi:[ribosomal protein S5]-alanine N-acetyltransferase
LAFLRSIFSPDEPPALSHGKVMLRAPRIDDFEEWLALRIRSRAFIEPWEPLWTEHDLTSHGFRQRLRRYHHQAKHDAGYAFFIFERRDGHLLGAITVSNVRRGVAQMCTVGYWIGAEFARNGYMTDALQAVTQHAFDTIGLHRVEAACIPANRASIALLAKCGFQQEGLARNYLKIAGKWQDHLLFSKIDG